jgi:CBS domain-containing protein
MGGQCPLPETVSRGPFLFVLNRFGENLPHLRSEAHPRAMTQGAERATAKSLPKKAPRSRKAAACAGDLMSSPARTCRPFDTLNVAAQVLWEHNVGAVVVVDDANEPVSMITDRDICFAAYTQGQALWNASVASAMAAKIVSCSHGTPINDVRQLMIDAKVRRIPVIDDAGKVVGVIGMADLCRTGTKTTTNANATQVLQVVSAWLAPAP